MNKHIVISDGSDNNIELTFDQNSKLHIQIEEPWAGDSEIGFGQSTGLYLDIDKIKELRDFLNKLDI